MDLIALNDFNSSRRNFLISLNWSLAAFTLERF